ncbi:hypothetical protein ACIPQJ_02570 [Streptomyces sp. NPDC090082]
MGQESDRAAPPHGRAGAALLGAGPAEQPETLSSGARYERRARITGV